MPANNKNITRVKTKIYILLMILWYSHSFGQNKFTKEGLKTGYWKEKHLESKGNSSKIQKELGKYKVVSLLDYDTIERQGFSYEVRYKSQKSLLYFGNS